MRRFVRPLAVFGVAGAAYLSGALEFAERSFIDLRFSTVQRGVSDELALIAIDPESIKQVGVWPWPRAFHAQMVQVLDEMGTGPVAYDVDFSAQTTEKQDSALEAALAGLATPPILPTFRQFADPTTTEMAVASLPLPRFSRHASLASINVRPDSDGVVRRVEPVQDFGDLIFPFLGVRLATNSVLSQKPFYIDYGIRVADLAVYSFVDVLLGKVDPEELRGRSILIGSSAVELGDQIAVPHYQALPGVYVQALAYESIVQGRALTRSPRWLVLLLTLGVAFGALWAMQRLSWKRASVVCGLSVGGVVIASLAIQMVSPILFDGVPLILAATLGYGASLVSTIGRQAQAIAFQTQETSIWRRRLFAVFEASRDAIISVGGSGEIRGLSGSATRQFGAEPLNHTRTLKDLMPLPPGAIPGGTKSETLGRRGDGTFFTAEVTVATVGDDERLAIIHDTTDRKLLEREAERFLNLSQDLVAVLGLDGRIQRLNPTWLRALGYESDSLIGNNLNVMLSGPGRHKLSDLIERKSQREATTSFEGTLNAKDGRAKQYHWIAVFSPDDTAIFVSGRDISERQKMEDMKDRFVTAVSEDLLLPLTALRGLIGALGTENEQLVDRRKILSLATHNAESAIRSINDILELKRIEDGTIETTLHALNIGEIVRAMIDDNANRARDANVTLTLTDRARELSVLGDRDQMCRVVSNLLQNAIEAAPPGTNVTVSLDRDGQSARISVRDEGAGIPANLRNQVFEPFGGQTGAQGGSNVGLCVAKRFVERHQGTVSFKTAEGKGTTFFITLPAHSANVISIGRREDRALH
ncbi:MAG: CHASE2 domain-containing protein [Alphaproteobacteria bacterium]|nr:CHASE2 domain-containing protein [Alphaproteobacteria bacterium]